MKRLIPSSLLLLAFGATAVVADGHEPTDVNEVIAKHIEAKGGRDAWNAIDNLRLTGEFTSFSRIRPFSMHKTRDRQYHMDTMWSDNKVVTGHDGAKPWTDNHFMRKGATEVEGPDLAVLERKRDFATALFDVEALGHTVELQGLHDLDGQETLAIKLTRADESEETWYIDPTTYLEVAHDSPASDFGRPMTQRTYFDEFREVAGVQIPHYTETQWYTRHRIVDAHTIEANVDVDENLFSMPPPYGMEKLQSLAGTWTVKVEARPSPQAPFTEHTQESTIESHFRGGMFEEMYTTPTGTDVVRTISYDQFRDRYLSTMINSGTNTLDILAGTWTEDGALLVDDVAMDTPALMFGLTLHERMKLYDLEADSFRIERETSIDGGENWAVMQKMEYMRKGSDDAGAED